MKTYKIERTRLITEVFRIKAETVVQALDKLDNCDTVTCLCGVEQLNLSTHHSESEVLSIEDTD